MTSILNSHLEEPVPGASVITIQLDGQARKVPNGSTLAQLVASLGHDEKAVSTAVNGDFVARTLRHYVLSEGDAVLLFQPIVGG
ncbi:sulfur carrier protein ThiS [Ottowia thiooxydans]|uniref:sulfur carrier protein ThiS n=1 Tax=Ottowia thiooxydans TaxID=219182 RepID=UPI0006861A81|nr:sulfur carrier protein ThiS [Ottowia thiooxydans]